MRSRWRFAAVAALFGLMAVSIVAPTVAWLRIIVALLFLVGSAWLAVTWLRDEQERGTRSERSEHAGNHLS